MSFIVENSSQEGRVVKKSGGAKVNNVTAELAALARMLTYARASASDLKLDLPVYCLDMALTAVLAEAEKSPEIAAAVERLELSASQMH